MQALRSLIRVSVDNPVMANVLMVAILVGGVYAAANTVRDTWPDFSLDKVEVEVSYPGASPMEVERSVCNRIEDAIQGVSGIRTVHSYARENHALIVLDLIERGADPSAVVRDVQSRIERITTFPPDVQRPIVREQIYRAQVINVAIYGDVAEQTLFEVARDVSDDLRDDPLISDVGLSGVREREITIEMSDEALQEYGLSFDDVMTVVARSTVDVPGGTLRTRGEEISLRAVGSRYTVRDFEDLVIIARPDGTLLKLRQVATVREGFEEANRRGWFNGQPAALVTVYKAPDQDASRIAARVRAYVDARQAVLPEALHMSVWSDGSRRIDDRVSMLLTDGITGSVLAILLLCLFLDLRLTLWVALGVPISFAGALIAMHWLGETISMISILGLIVTTGIVVDDSIIICDRFDHRTRAGQPPRVAAIEGTCDVALPVTGSAITTCVAFLPLVFVAGVAGRLINVLPIVVIVALAASQLEAFTALPCHLAHGGGVHRDNQNWHHRMRGAVDRFVGGFIRGVYRPVCRLATRSRAMTLSIAFAVLLLVAGLYAHGTWPLVLFPTWYADTVRARVRFPEGTPADVTQAALQQIERAAADLADDPDLRPARKGALVERVFSIQGEHAGFVSQYGSHLGEVTLELMTAADRGVRCDAIINHWRTRIGSIPGTPDLVVEQGEVGPQAPLLELKLFCDDLDRLRLATHELKAKLAEFKGVYDISDTLTPGKQELQISLKPAGRALGLTLEDLARQVRTGFHGGEAVSVQREREEVTVRVRYPDEGRGRISDIERMHIRTLTHGEVSFLEVAELRTARGYSMITHQNGKRRSQVVADVDARVTSSQHILASLEEEFLPDLVRRHKLSAYSLEGEHAQIQETLTSLMDWMILAMIANYAILATMLRSYLQPLVILSAVPLGFAGAVIGHSVVGYDLTMMSIFGMVALSGIVVNDALALVDQVNESVRAGVPVLQAVREAGEIRFRPVVLTAVSDILGVGPLLLDPSAQAQSIKPMAVSLVFGLTTATALTLLVVPALYLGVNDLKRLARWLRRGGSYPTAEAVEPLIPASHGSDVG